MSMHHEILIIGGGNAGLSRRDGRFRSANGQAQPELGSSLSRHGFVLLQEASSARRGSPSQSP